MCSRFYRLVQQESDLPVVRQASIFCSSCFSIQKYRRRYLVQKLFLFPWHQPAQPGAWATQPGYHGIFCTHTGRITISLNNFVTQVTKVNKRLTRIKQRIFLEQRKCSPSTHSLSRHNTLQIKSFRLSAYFSKLFSSASDISYWRRQSS